MAVGRRLAAFGFIAAVVTLAWAVTAEAKSFELNFDRATARPGTTVTARGSFRVYPALARVLPSVVVYLIPTRLGHPDYNTGWAILPPPGSRRTYRLGTMTQSNHRLFVRFVKPVGRSVDRKAGPSHSRHRLTVLVNDGGSPAR